MNFGKKLKIFLLISVFFLSISAFTLFFIQWSERSKASEHSGDDASETVLGRVRQNYSIPSILGFQTSLLTGDAAVDYRFDLPEGPGGIKPVLGMTYSSSTVADWGKGLGLGSKASSQYAQQASEVGFGWNMTGIGSISRVRAKNNDRDLFTINLGGASYKMVHTGSGWKTSPAAFLDIQHNVVRCTFNGQKTDDLDVWRVRDKSGTLYIFGDDVEVTGTTCRFLNNPSSSQSTAMRYRKEDVDSQTSPYKYEAYKWMLQKVVDLHGNNISYSYLQEKTNTSCDLDGEDSGDEKSITYSSSVLLDSIVYGSNNEFRVKLNYEGRPDYLDEKNDPLTRSPRTCDPDSTTQNMCSGAWKSHRQDACLSINGIDKGCRVDGCWGGRTSNSECLAINANCRWDESRPNNCFYCDCASPKYPLKCSQYYFTKKRVNNIEVSVNGAIRNVYDLSFVNDGPKFKDHNFSHSILTKITKRGKDGVGRLPPYTFSYYAHTNAPNLMLLKKADNGQGGLTTYTYSDQTTKRCRISGNCINNSSANRLAVTSKKVEDSVTGNKFTVSFEYKNGIGIFESQDKEDPMIYDGYQFLGFQTVLEKTSKNNNSDPARIIRTNFRISQGSEVTHCLNPDIYHGKVEKYDILNSNGTIESGDALTHVTNEYITLPFKPPPCENREEEYPFKILPYVALSKTRSSSDGVTQETRYEYDNYGNTILQSQLGQVDNPSDDKYIITRYVYNQDINILNTPYLNAISYDKDGTSLVSVKRNFYDGKELQQPPVKGDVTKIITGGSNTLAKKDRDNVLIASVKNSSSTEEVLGSSTDVVNVYVKKNSISGPTYNLENKRIELYRISNTCNNVCDSSCQDKVCKKKSSPYKQNIGYASFPPGTYGATYAFSIKELDSNFSQKICLVKKYPINTSCTIVVNEKQNPSTTVLPTGQTLITSSPGPTITTTPPSFFQKYESASSTSQFEYDKWGNQTKSINNLGRTTETKYDVTHTLPVEFINTAPFSWKKTIVYDPVLLKPIKETAENGGVVELEYDSFGRITKVFGVNEPKSEGLPSVKVTYKDSVFSVRSDILKDKSSANYSNIWFLFNGLGQQIQTQKEWGDDKIQIVETEFNSLGSIDFTFYASLIEKSQFGSFIKQTKDPDKGIIHNYDLLGREILTKYGDDTEVQTQYAGRTTTVIDRNGLSANKKVTTYDGQWRPIKLEEYGENDILTQQFIYDPNGKILSSTDPGNHQSTYQYDMLGRLLSKTSPDSGTTRFSYDELGNIKFQTDNKNQKIDFSYDELNRLIRKTYSDASSVVYAYDERARENKGRLTSVSYGGSISRYDFNRSGLLAREETTIEGNQTNYITSYTYDNIGGLKTIQYPEDNEIVTFTSDKANHLKSITSTLGPIIESVSYQPSGQMSELKYANNSVLNQTFYPGNFRLKDWKYSSEGNVLAEKSYEYDKVGNIEKIIDKKDNAKSYDYNYDQFYRLKSVSGGITANYVYDLDGDLIDKREDNFSIKSEYKPNDPIAVHAPKIVNSKVLQYDSNGNLLIDSNQNLKITYDFENRPIQIDNLIKENRVKYHYDGEGQRVKKEIYSNLTSSVPTSTVYFINGFFEVEIDSSNTKKVKKYYKNFAYREDGKIKFIASDHLASARIVTDSLGKLESKLDYYPYGLPFASNSNNTTSNTWIGQKQDQETGLYFLNSRFYNPTTGRFIQADNIDDPLTRGNRYVYGGNSPVVYSDPNGKCSSISCVVDEFSSAIKYVDKGWTTYSYTEPVVSNLGGITTPASSENPILFAIPIADPITGESSMDLKQSQVDTVVEVAKSAAISAVAEIGVVATLAAAGISAPAVVVGLIAYVLVDGVQTMQEQQAIIHENLKNNPDLTPPDGCFICALHRSRVSPDYLSTSNHLVDNGDKDSPNDPADNNPDVGDPNPDPGVNPPPVAAPPPPQPEPSEPPPSGGGGGGGGGGCFTGDTKILMKDGKYKNISDMKVGDIILTRELSDSPKLVDAEVTKVYVFNVNEYFIINDKIKVTGGHRFLINDIWTHVVDIKIGDKMVDTNDKTIYVSSKKKVANGNFTVYNLTVDTLHSFFADDIYVHNMVDEGK